jgi:plastocyanin
VAMKPRLVAILLAIVSIAPIEAQTVNECSFDIAEDLLSQATVTVTFPNGDFSYSPRCFLVRAGTEITFAGTFSSHPLVGGTVDEEGNQTPDPTSPIPATGAGSTATLTLNQTGFFGFYCNFHGGAFAMHGAVISVLFADRFETGSTCEWSDTVAGQVPC